MRKWATTDLEGPIRRWRAIAYLLAAFGLLAAFVVSPDARRATTVVLFVAALALSARPIRFPMRGLLLVDLGISVCVWWLYGPVSGAAFLAMGVVAIGPFVVRAREARVLVAAAVLSVPTEIGLHFLAGLTDLPLFHPPDPVPLSVFLTSQVIQAALLLGIGILMTGVARTLRQGQHALEADLERQRELNTLKDRFVATVSHELRTPLTSLKGFTKTLLGEDVSPSERLEFLTIMADQTEELHALIEDLITFSRLGAGGVAIRRSPVDLYGLTRSVVADLGGRAAHVENRIAPKLRVLADAPRLRQVIRNLVDNALKYGEPPVVLAAIDFGTEVHFSVLDGGTGIDRAAFGQVFEPYARLVEDPTMSSPGLGLGLPIVRELVRAHGGEIRLVREGAMSGFEFTLLSAGASGAASTSATTIAVG